MVARLEVESDQPRAAHGLFHRARRAIRGLFEVDFPEDAIPKVDQPCKRSILISHNVSTKWCKQVKFPTKLSPFFLLSKRRQQIDDFVGALTFSIHQINTFREKNLGVSLE